MNGNQILILSLMCLESVSCRIKNAEALPPDTNQQINYVINKDLNLKDYADTKSYFPKDGFIPNEEIAFQIAEIVLSQIYGKETIENEKPFSINLDNDVWIIEGSLKGESKGGTAYIEIGKQNGQILKVIHTE